VVLQGDASELIQTTGGNLNTTQQQNTRERVPCLAGIAWSLHIDLSKTNASLSIYPPAQPHVRCRAQLTVQRREQRSNLRFRIPGHFPSCALCLPSAFARTQHKIFLGNSSSAAGKSPRIPDTNPTLSTKLFILLQIWSTGEIRNLSTPDRAAATIARYLWFSYRLLQLLCLLPISLPIAFSLFSYSPFVAPFRCIPLAEPGVRLLLSGRRLILRLLSRDLRKQTDELQKQPARGCALPSPVPGGQNSPGICSVPLQTEGKNVSDAARGSAAPLASPADGRGRHLISSVSPSGRLNSPATTDSPEGSTGPRQRICCAARPAEKSTALFGLGFSLGRASKTSLCYTHTAKPRGRRYP